MACRRASTSTQSTPTARDSMLSIRADLRRVDECRRAVDEGAQWGGRLDAVVNAAGVWTEGPSADTTEEEWDRSRRSQPQGPVLHVHCGHPAPAPDARMHRQHVVRCRHPGQRRRGGLLRVEGRRVESHHAPSRSSWHRTASGSTPCARAMSTRRCCMDKRRRAPTRRPTSTSFYAGYPQGASARFIEPAEIAELIWFLAQPSASAITGANISIDFGLSAGIT